MERKERTYLQHYLSMAQEREQKEEKQQELRRLKKLKQGENIHVYDKVKLLNLTEHLMLDIVIVPDYEMNVFEGKYGQTSLFAQEILGCCVSGEFNYEDVEYKIVAASGRR